MNLNLILEVIIVYLLISTILNIVRLKKQKGKVSELQTKYESLSKEDLSELPDNELVEAVSFKVSDRYNYNHVGIAGLTDPEKMILTYDQMKICCTTPRMNINNFFNDFSAFVLYANQLFEIIPEGKESYDGAYQLYLNIQEEYKKDINEVIDDYDEPVTDAKTFIDYTNELKVIFNNPQTSALLAQYIKNNLDAFMHDNEVKDEDEDEEELSDFIDSDIDTDNKEE